MMSKKPMNKVDQAIAIAFDTVKKDAGVKPMDLFMASMGYAGVGLYLLNAPSMPGVVKVLGGVVLGTGLLAMVLISRGL